MMFCCLPASLQDYLTLPKRQALDSSALGWQQEGRRIGRRAQASIVGVLMQRRCDCSEACPHLHMQTVVEQQSLNMGGMQVATSEEM